ncbi:ComEA family DNA-binding protein [Listeria booriae]|uniref:ComEA family DNA-binding protein n=1 Tax=Listeria booriae TaxID=1552123 RepID=UPI001C8B92F7|nr:helix-hairpin-helix domain-containing protein [Listeria booriae]
MKYWRWIFSLMCVSLLFVTVPSVINGHSEVVYASETISQKGVDLNTASLNELKLLDGVGDVLAQRIVDGRPYESLDDLLNVKGIGEKTLIKIREQGIATVVSNKLEVNSFDDDDQVISGSAIPSSKIQIFINNVLNKTVGADGSGNFSYKIGYIDAHAGNKIKVEEWNDGKLIDTKEFTVKESGNIDYRPSAISVFKEDEATFVDSSNIVRIVISDRHKGLIKEADLNIKTNQLVYSADYNAKPDEEGVVTFHITPVYNASLVGKTITIFCKSIDSRKFANSGLSAGGSVWQAEKPVAENLKVVYNNNQLTFSGNASPGVDLEMGMAKRRYIKQEIALTPDFLQYKSFIKPTDYKMDYLGDSARYLSKYNIPLYIQFTQYPLKKISYYTEVQNFDIDQPPASIVVAYNPFSGGVTNGNVSLTGIPKSKVKLRFSPQDYSGYMVIDSWDFPTKDIEYTVELDDMGAYKYNYQEDFGFDFQLYNFVYVTNIVDGKSGKENKMFIDGEYCEDDFGKRVNLFVKQKELLIND